MRISTGDATVAFQSDGTVALILKEAMMARYAVFILPYRAFFSLPMMIKISGFLWRTCPSVEPHYCYTLFEALFIYISHTAAVSAVPDSTFSGLEKVFEDLYVQPVGKVFVELYIKLVNKL